MTRNNKGQFARSKAKDTIAVLLTIFISVSVAYTAHSATKDYDVKTSKGHMEESGMVSDSAQQPSGYCLQTGNGTGRIESYCADTKENLIEAIKTEWEETEQVAQNNKKQPTPNNAKTRTSSYKRKGWNQEIADIIKAEAEAQGWEDLELAYNIVDCESMFNPKATNGRGNSPSWSVDEGLWQYNNHWQRNNITSECAFDARCSTKQAIKDLINGKASQWACYKIVK